MVKNSLILMTFIFIIFSCSNKEKKIIVGEILKSELNYYKNDSLQKVVGYYPPKIYFTVRIINKTDSDLFIPLKERVDNGYKSEICGIINNDTLHLYQISNAKKNFIRAKDTLSIYLGLKVKNNKNFGSNIEYMKYLSKNLALKYLPKKEEIEIKKPVSISINFIRTNNYKTIFRDSSDRSIHMWE